jgi:2-polyprenyl-6-methoxyphenol hydroxylase-like FAD-dependent oxidoreductase
MIQPSAGQGAAISFESACTLAYVMSRRTVEELRSEALLKWEQHRMARIEKIRQISERSGSLRTSTSTYFGQLFKEWAIWLYASVADLRRMAKEGYMYNCETVIEAIS